jgi:hypothetical protein
MDNLNLLGNFDSVWIYVKFYGWLLILQFANTWNVLVYYTFLFRIKQLLCMLLLALHWYPGVLSISPTCSFLLLLPHLTSSFLPIILLWLLLCSMSMVFFYYFEVQIVSITSAKWCVVYLTGVVQSFWNPLFTYLFANLSYRVLWLLRQALYQLSHSSS